MRSTNDEYEKRLSNLVESDAWPALLEMVELGKLDPNQSIPTAISGSRISLLNAAISTKHSEAAVSLIKAGAGIDGGDGGAPILNACWFQDHAVISALIAAGANVNAREKKSEDGGGETALITAAEKGDLWAVKHLIAAGADMSAATFRRESALYWAVRSGNQSLIKELVSAGCPLLGNELHRPVVKRDVNMVKFLLGCGFDANGVFPKNDRWEDLIQGDTPLIAALRKGVDDYLHLTGTVGEPTAAKRREITKLLLSAGARPNVANAKGASPLLYAVQQKELGLAKLLIKAGADPCFAPAKEKQKGKFPLAIAKKNRLFEFVLLFEEKGREEW